MPAPESHGITPEAVEEFTQGAVGSSTPGLEARIEQVVAAARGYCGWHVFPVLRSIVVLDGPGSSVLQLPSLRVTRLISVRERGEELDPDVLDWSPRGMLAKARGRFTDRLGSVVVEFEHGHERCPDVEAVILSVLARGAQTPVPGRSSYTVGQRSESFASVRGSFGTVAPFADELAVLARHRLPPLAGGA